MGNTSPRLVSRLKRKRRIRKNIFGNQDRPRLSVFRSSKHIYAQIIDDTKGITKVVLDRNGFLYHGRIKALSDAAREAGLLF